RPVPKDHSTIRLYGLAADLLKAELDPDILTDLDDLYIDARYPGELGLLPYGRPTVLRHKVQFEVVLMLSIAEPVPA
ncbi:MAG: HEPN domain-containing protein, partial [Anaerolineales bacterium]